MGAETKKAGRLIRLRVYGGIGIRRRGRGGENRTKNSTKIFSQTPIAPAMWYGRPLGQLAPIETTQAPDSRTGMLMTTGITSSQARLIRFRRQGISFDSPYSQVPFA